MKWSGLEMPKCVAVHQRVKLAIYMIFIMRVHEINMPDVA